MAKAKTRKRTEDSYLELDQAMGYLLQFSKEIRWMLCQSAINERAVDDILNVM